MKLRLSLATFVLCALPMTASADMRELGQEELREIVQSNQILNLKQVLVVIEESVGGEFIDARAFEGDGIYYRVLVKLPDGRLGAVLVDAETGTFLQPGSKAAKNLQAASSSKKSAKSNSAGKAKGKSSNSGKGGRAEKSGGGDGGKGGGPGGNSHK